MTMQYSTAPEAPMESQAQAIADIALDLPPPSQMTSRDILTALNKAYRAGLRQGVMVQGRANEAVMGVIGRLMEPRV